MPCTVAANFMGVIHKTSIGIGTAFPDVCKTPAPPIPSPIPIPYPNIAMSSDLLMGTVMVTADGQSVATQSSFFSMSTGDEAGVAGGVASGLIKGKADFVMFSMNVQMEGQSVTRSLMDPMLYNNKNTPPFPVLQPPVP
jgi:hypothetical protein